MGIKNKLENLNYQALFSALAIAISISTLAYTMNKDYNLNRTENARLIDEQKEVLNPHYSAYGPDNVIDIETSKLTQIGIDGLIPLNYEIILTNTTKNTISIVEASVTQNKNGNFLSFPGLLDKIYMDDGKIVKYPIDIEAGKSIKLDIRIKLGIKKSILESLKIDGKIQKMKITDFRTKLDKSSEDIFGNAFSKIVVGKESFIKEFPKLSYPEYIVLFITGKGTKIPIYVSPSEYFKQI
jgi:hypothetical protein